MPALVALVEGRDGADEPSALRAFTYIANALTTLREQRLLSRYAVAMSGVQKYSGCSEPPFAVSHLRAREIVLPAHGCVLYSLNTLAK